MNNPMEFFRKGAEKRKANAVKKSMYQNGDEVYGPKTQSESELEKLQLLSAIGLGNQEIITPKPLNPNKPTPPPGKFFGRWSPRFGYEILDEDPVVTARKEQQEAKRNALMKNPQPTKLMGRPPKPRSMVQNAMMNKLRGL